MSRSFGSVLRIVVVLALTLAGLAVWRYDLADDLTDDALDAVFSPRDVAAPESPETIEPPAELALPPLSASRPVAPVLAARPGRLNRGMIGGALEAQLSDPDLGKHVLSAVSPLGAKPVYRSRTGSSSVAIPASTTKLVTSTAALLALGPDHRFDTTVVRGAGNQIVLVGGGDPFLASAPPGQIADAPTYPERADVVTLAKKTAVALLAKGRKRVAVAYDASLFSGPEASPAWERDYLPDGVVAPIEALWVDEGRPGSGSGRVDEPAETAATVFSGALSNAGVEVIGVPEPGSAPAGSRTPLAEVSSAPLSQIVERVLDVSDNEAAEVLLRHVGVATGGEGSFDAGRLGELGLFKDQGIEFGPAEVLYDGSGLSRRNRLSPTTLIDVLTLAARADRPGLRSVVAGLPVAGFTGSLTDRFDEGAPEGRGRVRAKTGTLTAVTSLAGIAADRAGNLMVFALMADRVKKVDEDDARVAMDNAASALGACLCGR